MALLKSIDSIPHKPDKAIPFAAHAFHDSTTIDGDVFRDDAELSCVTRLMVGIRRGNQKLGRHAAIRATLSVCFTASR